MNTAPANINAASATFCIAFVFFSNAEALRFFFIALPTPSIASEIDSITAKGDVSLSAASDNFLAINSIPTPAPAETILLIPSPSFNSLNFSNISEPKSFIVSQTFDAVLLIPLIKPSTINSPLASISLDGDAIPRTSSNFANSLEPISFSISGMIDNPPDNPFFNPAMINSPASERSTFLIVSINF